MASPPFNIQEAVPADDGIVAQFPTQERSFRDIVESWLLVDHNVSGYHKYVTLSDQGGDPTFPASTHGIWMNNGKLNTRSVAGTVMRVVQWQGGGVTRVVFKMEAPPAGWTLDTTPADRVLIFALSGNTGGGSWTISGLTVQPHQLTIDEMPNHQHGNGGATTKNASFAGGGSPVAWAGAAQNTDFVGNNVAHSHNITHDSNWRPLYATVIAATLD